MFGVDGMARTAPPHHAVWVLVDRCAGSGGRKVLFGVDSMAGPARAPCHDGRFSSKWMGRDYPRSMPCGFGRTEGPVWGRWHYSCTVPCMLGKTNSLIQGGWHCQDCLHIVPPSFGWFGADSMIGTAHVPCHSGFGRRTVLFEENGRVRTGPLTIPCGFWQMDIRFEEDSTTHGPCRAGSCRRMV